MTKGNKEMVDPAGHASRVNTVSASNAQLLPRTKSFALRVVRLVESLPKGRVGDVIGRQLLRAATSVGANYRAARRARSAAEFRAKLGIVEEEADECAYWLELIAEAQLVQPHRLEGLHQEANELLAMIVASIRTSRSHARRRPK
jgi:four helix bundle protein